MAMNRTASNTIAIIGQTYYMLGLDELGYDVIFEAELLFITAGNFEGSPTDCAVKINGTSFFKEVSSLYETEKEVQASISTLR